MQRGHLCFVLERQAALPCQEHPHLGLCSLDSADGVFLIAVGSSQCGCELQGTDG